MGDRLSVLSKSICHCPTGTNVDLLQQVQQSIKPHLVIENPCQIIDELQIIDEPMQPIDETTEKQGLFNEHSYTIGLIEPNNTIKKMNTSYFI